MTIYLLRHGVAEPKGVGKPDRDRRLTPRGRARMRRAAQGLRALVGPLDALYTSPYPRAAETATIAAAALAKAPKPQPLDVLAHGTSPMEALRVLRATATGQRMMLVGHEPELSQLASLLLTGSIEGMRLTLKKGGCLAITIRTLAPRLAVLDWLVTPRALRRIGRSAVS